MEVLGADPTKTVCASRGAPGQFGGSPSKLPPGGQTVSLGYLEPSWTTLTAAAIPDVVSWVGKVDPSLDLP